MQINYVDIYYGIVDYWEITGIEENLSSKVDRGINSWETCNFLKCYQLAIL